MIRVVPEHEPLSIRDVAAACRVQGNVSKKAAFASVDPATREATYVGITFNPELSADPLKKHERKVARRVQDASAEADGVAPPPKKSGRKRGRGG